VEEEPSESAELDEAERSVVEGGRASVRGDGPVVCSERPVAATVSGGTGFEPKTFSRMSPVSAEAPVEREPGLAASARDAEAEGSPGRREAKTGEDEEDDEEEDDEEEDEDGEEDDEEADVDEDPEGASAAEEDAKVPAEDEDEDEEDKEAEVEPEAVEAETRAARRASDPA
jgi:hypothetical protein